ncbi:MAG TPA: hypothetical protein VGC42_32440 [Kofleriaceae bacterium]
MKRCLRLGLGLGMLGAMLVPSIAWAQPADSTRMVTDDCARARKAGKTCVLEVGAEDVGGDAPTAGELTVRARAFLPGNSLIRLRRDFIPEIVKSAEDL